MKYALNYYIYLSHGVSFPNRHVYICIFCILLTIYIRVLYIVVQATGFICAHRKIHKNTGNLWGLIVCLSPENVYGPFNIFVTRTKKTTKY